MPQLARISHNLKSPRALTRLAIELIVKKQLAKSPGHFLEKIASSVEEQGHRAPVTENEFGKILKRHRPSKTNKEFMDELRFFHKLRRAGQTKPLEEMDGKEIGHYLEFLRDNIHATPREIIAYLNFLDYKSR